jgi:hypothetical protein
VQVTATVLDPDAPDSAGSAGNAITTDDVDTSADVQSDASDIDNVDRRSDNVSSSEGTAMTGGWPGADFTSRASVQSGEPARRTAERERDPRDADDAGDEDARRPVRDWRRMDPRAQDAHTAEGWEPQALPAATALHASLDLVSRRRLQMIEAMASFSAEGSASLELRPQRRIDAKTYELLTAVSLSRNVA